MLCPRVVGEGTGRGKGESITAKAMTSRQQMPLKLISAQCSLYIAEKKYVFTHMLRSTWTHPLIIVYVYICTYCICVQMYI